MPRGTIMELESFNLRGRKCVHLKHQEKVWRFNAHYLHSYDIHPAGEVDLSKAPDVMHMEL
jgi:hypothetical protein